jgi:hypothetical protein
LKLARILVAIPHFFRRQATGRHGSTQRDPLPRIRALSACITGLRANLASEQVVIQLATRTAQTANRSLASEIDIAICTTGADHLVERLPLPRDWFRHVPTNAKPELLGYECHAVLRDGLDAYDYFAFLEDDLVVHDPTFVTKTAWFAQAAGEDAVLQPNRFEINPGRVPPKAYIDGDIVRRATLSLQDVDHLPEIKLSAFGREIVFRRPLNPHAGCFLINRAQMRRWAAQPYFLDRSAAFVGPLESAATLGLMRTFRVYKPAVANAGFLEIEHAGQAFIGQIGSVVAFADEPGAPSKLR